MTMNVAVDRTDGPSADFVSYLLVTQWSAGARRRIPGGVLKGTAVRTATGYSSATSS